MILQPEAHALVQVLALHFTTPTYQRFAIEAGRAERQYHACEPENRLVARTLERRWEEALRQKQQLDKYARWQRSAPAELSDRALSSIRALAADLPAVRSATTTTPADRQRIARLPLERIIVTVDKTSERVDVVLHWGGGAVRSHTLTRAVNRYDQRSEYPRLVARLRELCTGRLNAEGFQPPKRASRFTREMVLRLIGPLGLTRRPPHGSRGRLGCRRVSSE